jgi:hypothetical protein
MPVLCATASGPELAQTEGVPMAIAGSGMTAGLARQLRTRLVDMHQSILIACEF